MSKYLSRFYNDKIQLPRLQAMMIARKKEALAEELKECTNEVRQSVCFFVTICIFWERITNRIYHARSFLAAPNPH